MNDAKISTKVPPDGGYGWVIALAMALNNFIYIPLMQCFGLIFKDTFKDMELSGAQSGLIINLHGAFGLMMGLLNGVLLKMYGYRKAAILGAVLFFAGVTLTAFATSFAHFIIFYGLVGSMGVGISKAANSLALNTFFKKRRNKAMGFAITITGLGSIILPQFINLLLKIYTPRGVMLIIGGISAHFFATALLLQPIKWHMKGDEEPLKEEPSISDEKFFRDHEIYDSIQSLDDYPSKQKKSMLEHLVSIFDLDLLQDPVFVNILLGLALAVFSEMNFTVLTPFILSEFGLNTDQIATFISLAAVTDIVFRLLAPHIGDYLKKSPRFMYITTLVVLIVLRFWLIFLRNYYLILTAAAGLGMAKGIRRVYVGLIVPAHVSLEKLPSASGMEMMANGICILTGGWILGIIRDLTGNYIVCIVIMNCVTLVTIIMWSVEGVLVCHLRKKRALEAKKREAEEDIPLKKV